MHYNNLMPGKGGQGGCEGRGKSRLGAVELPLILQLLLIFGKKLKKGYAVLCITHTFNGLLIMLEK